MGKLLSQTIKIKVISNVILINLAEEIMIL